MTESVSHPPAVSPADGGQRISTAGQTDGRDTTFKEAHAARLGRTETMGKTVAVLIARLIFGGVFAMAASFKFLGMEQTAGYIAAAGFPLALPLAWIAAFFESALAIALWTGFFFSEAALLAAAYVLFLAFVFHGPSHWSGNQTEFGFFVDHFTFIAGLLFAAVHGPGGAPVVRRSFIWRPRDDRRLSADDRRQPR